jgi:2-octaprenylphenol hydroxylase
VPTQSFEVAIVGAGPVGACAAALLARSGAVSPRRIALIDQQTPPRALPSGPIDLRVFALSRASERILTAAGAWQSVRDTRVSEYERMHVWHASVPPRGGDALEFSADEVGERNLGCIVENCVLQRAAFDAARAEGVAFFEVAFSGIRLAPDAAMISLGGSDMAARLLVGADGAASRVRALADLGAEVADYLQLAIVCVVRTEKSHERTAWQRFLDDGTLAFLPLSDGTSSVVWSVSSARAEALLAAPPAAFAAELTRESDDVLGGIELLSERAAFPLRKLSAEAYVRERVALIGDAAHVIHPLAGQGANLGLLDAATLAEVLIEGAAQREDLGALRLLRKYERWRRSENQLISRSMDAFNRLLAQGAGPLASIAQRGLSLVNRSTMAKRFFMERALGTSGELPSFARS